MHQIMEGATPATRGVLAAELHGGRWPQLCPSGFGPWFFVVKTTKVFGSAQGKPSAPGRVSFPPCHELYGGILWVVYGWVNGNLVVMVVMVVWVGMRLRLLKIAGCKIKILDKSLPVAKNGPSWQMKFANFSECIECN